MSCLQVCTQLHFFLQSRFPEEYERRHQESQGQGDRGWVRLPLLWRGT